MTTEEYLALERKSKTKHEFYAGRAFAMAGTSSVHSTICFNLARILGNALLGKPCQPFGMDLRLKVSVNGLYTYPDVMVVCGEPLFEDAHGDTLLNPTVIFEVLSASTEAYDRGRKFAMYAALDSLAGYVLVTQDQMRVEHFAREGVDDWHLTAYKAPTDTVGLVSIGCNPTLAEIYGRVEFGPPGPLRAVSDETP